MQKESQNHDFTSRIFFGELLKSDLFIKENGATFLVTPTCAICNRLFGVGEVKEMEKRGNITKIKISDSTGTLNIYTDKVIKLKSNKFLAFVGNLHMRVSEGAGEIKSKGVIEGAGEIKSKGVLILVEEAGAVEENVRNNWIINTARRTMERIELLRNLSLEGQGYLIASCAADAKPLPKKQWLNEAREHYAIDDIKQDFWETVAINAVKRMYQYYSKTTKEMVLDLLVGSETGMERVRLTKELKKSGLMEELVEEVIDELIADGRCYEPEVGVLKVVE